MPNAFVTLPVPSIDGVGAWVDTSGMAPGKTLTVDGGAFSGQLYIESSNDGQASAVPVNVAPFVGGAGSPVDVEATLQFMRVRRIGSNTGPVGAPTVAVSAEVATSNVFGSMNVTPGDGTGTAIDLSSGGAVNTFNIKGPFSGQVTIQVSGDGVNFSPVFTVGLVNQTSPSPAGINVIGVVSSARVVRNGSLPGQPAPLISAGSGGESGGGGSFPGFGGAPPAVAAASSAGGAGTASRSDHTHAGVVSVSAGTGISVTGTASAPIVNATGTAFPGFGTPGTLGPTLPTAGTSSLALRADSLPGQLFSATWPIANTRWYAVDGVNGNDNNQGWSDVDLPTAGAVAKKTIAALGAILPRLGCGRQVGIVIAAGTYIDGLDTLLVSVSGYVNGPLIRGTVTDVTAASVAFANDANECIMAGGVRVPGLNNSGYNPVSAFSTTVLKCLQVGGAAPAFPAEPASPLGWRIRFLSTTATSALANACGNIVKVVTDTLTLMSALPATPTGADVFVVEQAGVVVAATNIASQSPVQSLSDEIGTQIVGIRSAGGLVVRGNCVLSFSFCGWASLFADTIASEVRTNGLNAPLYVALNGQFPNPGGGLRFEGTAQAERNHFRLIGAVVAAGGVVCIDVLEIAISTGSVIVGVIQLDGMRPSMEEGDITIGSPLSVTGPPCRAINGGRIVMTWSNAAMDGFDFEGVGAHPAISLRGTCKISLTSGITGSTGNTDVGLDLTASKGSLIVLNSQPTLTGTAGDVRLADGTIVSWASLVAQPLVDVAGNQFVSAGGNAFAKPIANGAQVIAIGTTGPAAVGTPAGATGWEQFKLPNGTTAYRPYWT